MTCGSSFFFVRNNVGHALIECAITKEGERLKRTLDWLTGLMPLDLRQPLDKLIAECREPVEEFRLRLGRPPSVTVSGMELGAESGTVTREHLHTVLENASQASVHTVLEQVKHGYITLKGGHRMGLCGTASYRNGEIMTMRYLTSLALRIARAAKGVAAPVLPQLMEQGQLQNTLILAPPGVGKTTLLRDLVRTLSEDGFRVGVADERGELAALWEGEPQFDIGRCTDVIDGCPKREGMSILLRGMNPQVLAADEITDPKDVRVLRDACGCGVALLATAHGGSLSDLKQRPVYRGLLECNVFQRVVLLERHGTCRRVRVEGLR